MKTIMCLLFMLVFVSAYCQESIVISSNTLEQFEIAAVVNANPELNTGLMESFSVITQSTNEQIVAYEVTPSDNSVTVQGMTATGELLLNPVVTVYLNSGPCPWVCDRQIILPEITN
jgi:hypothetical protein